MIDYRADLMVTVALRVRARRDTVGLSQAALARKCGWESGMMISHLESGERLPSVASLVALADALGTTTDHLLGR